MQEDQLAIDRALYERDGIFFPLRVMSPHDAAHLRAACDRLEVSLGGKPRTVEVRQMHLHFAWADALARRPRILEAVSAVLGPDLAIWATELFAKHPRDSGVSIAWHRDMSYSGLSAPHAVTAWIALSPSTRANGCMLAYPGPERATTPSLDVASPDSAVAVELEPGEMSLHDGQILHGSVANTSGEKRVGFAIRYVSPSAVPRHGRPRLVRALGSAAYPHCEVMDPPAMPPCEAEALSALRGSAMAHFDEILWNVRDRPASSRAAPEGKSSSWI